MPNKPLTIEEMDFLRKKFIPTKKNPIICNLDGFGKKLHCVNNYRGKDYKTPNTTVPCNVCVFNPKNAGLSNDLRDIDKVILRKGAAE